MWWESSVAVEAVIFDWGGTLTPWHTIDLSEESVALAAAATEAGVDAAEVLRAAGDTLWGRSRDHHHSATIEAIFAEAGLGFDDAGLTAYREFWEPHTFTHDDVRPLFEWLREEGLKVGVLSNTVWPRAWHEDIFVRDGIAHLIDGAVYTSEIPWTKPAPEAFRAAMEAVGVTDPAACIFVGDRLFDDIYGARNAGMVAVHVPHSDIPAAQLGHTAGEPDAVVQRLADLPDVIATWR
jgi:putative hydrolase of the HAD superfamily